MHALAALLFGIVAGMRTFTGEAVCFGLRGHLAGIIFAVLAVGEYIADALPWIPARTQVFPLLARIVSGAFMGWVAARIPGIVLGIIGALAGTFAGYRLRMRAIEAIGALPAALLEDVVAIALAFGAVALQAKP